MVNRLIVVSGRVGSGKTTLAESLADKFAVHLIKTRRLLMDAAGFANDRVGLQGAGERLDQETGGQWLSKAVLQEVEGLPDNVEAIVDAVRIIPQVESLRAEFGPRVFHVHLLAGDEDLRARFLRRKTKRPDSEPSTYEEVQQNATEQHVDSLGGIADVVIQTGECDKHDVLVRVASHLGYYGSSTDRLVDVMVGGQWGSEGKGNMASYLAPEYGVLVRVGGPNAGHKVYLGETRIVTFRHLPSGTLSNESAQIVIAPGSTIRIQELMKEIAECELHVKRLSIDPQAMIIDDWDCSFEEELKKTIGSTGEGVGAATARRVLRNSFPGAPKVSLARDAPELKQYLRSTREVLDDAFRLGQRVFLEGTQGTGLSIYHGDYPYTTSRDTTTGTCLAEAGVAPSRVRRLIMVCRTYPIRVKNPEEGTSGPMGREISYEQLAARSGNDIEELRNTEMSSVSKTQRRIAEFNWHLLRRAASINGPTDIALSFADYIDAANKQAHRFDQLTPPTIQFIEEVERVAAAPVTLISVRFHLRSIIDRRRW